MDIERFIAVADAIASFSKDPTTKVGAVIVDNDGAVISMGYNGFPRGIEDTGERLCSREIKHQLMVHAEMNAILAAARTGSRLYGTTLVSSMFPCSSCALAIVQAGIVRVMAPEPSNPRWIDSNRLAMGIFKEGGVKVEYIDR